MLLFVAGGADNRCALRVLTSPVLGRGPRLESVDRNARSSARSWSLFLISRGVMLRSGLSKTGIYNAGCQCQLLVR